MAEIIGTTEETIYHWENNKNEPKIRYWPGIISFLGYDPEFIEGKTLSAVLQNYRRANGIIRKELADIIGVDETTVLWWERGKEVKLKRSIAQLKKFFLKVGIPDVDIPFYDASIRAKEAHRRQKQKH